MKKSIYILLLILFQCLVMLGQKEGDVYISNNKLYGELSKGLPENDKIIELKENEILIGKGAVAVGKNGVSDLKVGYWKEYYENGTLKMEGNYLLGSYIQCCASGACRSFYYYRNGLWKFYDDECKQTYELNFESTKMQIDTNCEGGYELLFGIIKKVPSKYKGDLTSDQLLDFQRIKIKEGRFTEIWELVDGKVIIDMKTK